MLPTWTLAELKTFLENYIVKQFLCRNVAKSHYNKFNKLCNDNHYEPSTF